MSEVDRPTTPAAADRTSRSSSVPPDSRAKWSASADSYRALIEAADEAILVADFEGGLVIEANPAACELFGYSVSEFSEVAAKSLGAEDDSDVEQVFQEIALRERAAHPNLRFRTAHGATFWGELRAKVFVSAQQKLVLFIIRDATVRVEREQELARAHQSLKDTQAKLLHSGKLAAIGQIAGGVAHEVNNPATFILTNLRVMRGNIANFRGAVSRLRRELSRGDVPPEERLTAAEDVINASSIDAELRDTNEMIDDNLAGIERIASIVNDLRTFSRIEQDDVREIQVNDLVDVACSLALADIRHRARLLKELAKLPLLSAEPGKLAQVLTNLLLYAAHTIDEGAANENEIRVSSYVERGFIVVAIQSSGRLIPEDVQARLFEPFYAGESSDYRVGIGLSLCAEIVRMHAGSIEVKNVAGGGNRFEVRLPVPEVVAPESRADVVPAAVASVRSLGRARVLVIDDDVAVLRAYRRILSARHDVVLASGGAEGLDILQKDSAFDIVLCDVMMPQVDGPMVYEALRSRAPELLGRLVFCSGGAFTPRAKEFLASVENPFLSKPIDVAALESAIERARQRRAAAS